MFYLLHILCHDLICTVVCCHLYFFYCVRVVVNCVGGFSFFSCCVFDFFLACSLSIVSK